MTREYALKELLSKRGIYKSLGVDRVTVASLKRRLKEGRLPIEKQHEILKKGGYNIAQEEIWTK